MEDEETDLRSSRFFTTLQQKFTKLFKRAEENRYLICVPTNSALGDEKVTQALIEGQILAPSPLFAETYTTLSKVPGEVTVKDSALLARKGFKHPGTVKILSEEVFYNAKYESFRVLVVDGLFDQPPTAERSRKSSPSNNDIFRTRSTVEEQLNYISAHCSPDALQRINDVLRTFVDGYMIVKGFAGDFLKKVETLHKLTTDALQQGCPEAVLHQADYRLGPILGLLAEAYMFRRIYEKVVEGIKADFGAKDALFERRSRILKDVSGQAVGIPGEFVCDMSVASQELRRLPECTTPLEKLQCLKTVFTDINTAVEMHVKRSQRETSVAIASDDLIPLLAQVVLRAGLPDMHTQLQLLEAFTFAEHNQELQFLAVTLHTSVEYLCHFDNGDPALQALQRQSSSSSSASSAPASAKQTPPARGASDSQMYASASRGLQPSVSDMITYHGDLPADASGAVSRSMSSGASGDPQSSFSSPAPGGARGSATATPGSQGRLNLAAPQNQQRASSQQMGSVLSRLTLGF